MTQKQKIEGYDKLASENYRLSIMVHILANGEVPEHKERVYDSEYKATYTLKLFRSTAAHGGIVLWTFACPGQNASQSVFFVDDLNDGRIPRGRIDQLTATAVSRIVAARNKRCRA